MKTTLKISLILLALTTLAACASRSFRISQTPDFNLSKLSTFQIEPIRISHTHGSTDQIIPESENLTEKIRKDLLEDSYREVNDGSADFRIGLRLVSIADSVLADPNLDYMKGVQGSNFPLANPRVRTYQTDVLQLEVRTKSDSVPSLIEACRLDNINSDTKPLSPSAAVMITIPLFKVESCLKTLLNHLPPSR